MKPLLRCLITAGPTREHIDPVRFLSNGSSGRMGYALAGAALARGWHVDLVSGPVALPPLPSAVTHRVVSAAQMLAACEPLFDGCDVFIAVAAVADFRPKVVAGEKMKKSATAEGMTLELVPTVDILKTLSGRRRPGQVLVGFAAETHDLEASGLRKLADKNLDLIVANDVSRPGMGMEAENNAVVLLSRAGERWAFGPVPKRAVAEFILEKVVAIAGR
ncbi:MAG TPA: phosphopantothenoylcysteine decarboxylase [Opitutaceae bacterium]|jgi:phosphopantothenoylcysteine decarboxylase/phosphopantothenate--cysteine ligase|nr:phosphopantothenoylcysteine decarboxylase [Opitutaceae bacterium]